MPQHSLCSLANRFWVGFFLYDTSKHPREHCVSQQFSLTPAILNVYRLHCISKVITKVINGLNKLTTLGKAKTTIS